MKKFLIIMPLFLFLVFLPSLSSANFEFTFNEKEHSIPDLEEMNTLQYFIIEYNSSWNLYNIYSFSNIDNFKVNDNSNSYGLIAYNTYFSMYQYWPKTKKIDVLKDNIYYDFFNEQSPYKNGIAVLNFDLKNSEGVTVLEKNTNYGELELNLTLEPETITSSLPVYIYSQMYSSKLNYKITCYYENRELYEDYEIEEIGESVTGAGALYKRYRFNIYKNGTYHFILQDWDTGKKVEKDLIVDNIIYTQDNVNNYINGVFDPSPFLEYEYVNDKEVLIITQKFKLDEVKKLECYYAKDIDPKTDYDNTEKWTKAELRPFYDELSNQILFQFYVRVNNENLDANGTYYVKFYNIPLKKSTYGSITIDFNSILEVDGSILFKYAKLFKDKFGFLSYPVELFINVLDRFLNINFEEPVFDIPDIYEPTTNVKIISATHFDFNELLKNETLKSVHDVYLIIVDAVIVFCLANLAYHKLKGVLNN